MQSEPITSCTRAEEGRGFWSYFGLSVDVARRGWKGCMKENAVYVSIIKEEF